MLVLAIVATVILGLKILFGWLCKVIVKSGKIGEVAEDTKGLILGFSSWGIINTYMIVVIWVLYANIGG